MRLSAIAMLLHAANHVGGERYVEAVVGHLAKEALDQDHASIHRLQAIQSAPKSKIAPRRVINELEPSKGMFSSKTPRIIEKPLIPVSKYALVVYVDGCPFPNWNMSLAANNMVSFRMIASSKRVNQTVSSHNRSFDIRCQ